MPRRSAPPKTFDQHLGRVIDGALDSYGGRPAVGEWLRLSERSVERRMRGEVPIFVSELRVIAEHINWPMEQIVQRAIDNYGGLEKLLADSAPVSEPPLSLDEERERRQKIAAQMTVEEIESPTTRKVAERDDERREDETPTP